MAIDVEIDKLTNSIENVRTGEVFDTVVARLSVGDKKRIRKKDWRFNWHSELVAGRELYALTTVQNPSIIQGLIA